MVSSLLDHRMKKRLAVIDRLITELIIVRQYMRSARVGITYCRKHVTRGSAVAHTDFPVESHFVKNQELLLYGLRKAEKRLKRQLLEASRELALVCGSERAAGHGEAENQ